jgi:hypothetical protein
MCSIFFAEVLLVELKNADCSVNVIQFSGISGNLSRTGNPGLYHGEFSYHLVILDEIQRLPGRSDQLDPVRKEFYRILGCNQKEVGLLARHFWSKVSGDGQEWPSSNLRTHLYPTVIPANYL